MISAEHLISYKRSLLRYFEQHEIDRSDRGAFISRQWSDRERGEAWLRDSLIWGIDEFLAGRLKYAYRGVIEAAKEAGVIGHDSTTNDAYITLKNACEEALEHLEVERDQALCVLHDHFEEQSTPWPARRIRRTS